MTQNKAMFVVFFCRPYTFIGTAKEIQYGSYRTEYKAFRDITQTL